MTSPLEELRTNGFCRLPQVYESEHVRQTLDLVREWNEKQSLTENLPRLVRDTPQLWNLQSKDFSFLELLFEPRQVEELLIACLNDPWYPSIPQDAPNYILRAYQARSSSGALPLHIDSFVPYKGDHTIAMQVSIVLEDMSAVNGCTIAVPGSHQSGEFAFQDALPDAVPLEAEAGDVVIWDSRLWHGATENTSGRTRWAIIATFTRWWIKQAFKITENVPQDIYERLTPRQKAVLGYCTIPYNDESEGIDMRHGYDVLDLEASTVAT
ncbi:MAG: phytanoyl-CoA dioxygenase family protein [Vicinamibacteria bacterium]